LVWCDTRTSLVKPSARAFQAKRKRTCSRR
jgi:hypothetical protein